MPGIDLNSCLRRLLLRVSGAVLAGLVISSSAMATSLEKAEAWFSSITTLEARFIQVSSDGSSAEGQFYLWRPYRSRFEYDDPVPLTLITTRTWLHVDEEDRRQITSYPVSETPLAVILADPVRLEGEGFTTRAESRDGVTRITLDQPEGEAAGRIVLEFTEQPFVLRRWLVTDANGITTSVLLSNITKGHKLSPRLFVPTEYPDTRN
ncbi:outer membrane lipoprotein carrier protein LolA [Alphaproteobacteria bacterium LSUCC0684]